MPACRRRRDRLRPMLHRLSTARGGVPIRLCQEPRCIKRYYDAASFIVKSNAERPSVGRHGHLVGSKTFQPFGPGSSR
jgi:hypothetical protein